MSTVERGGKIYFNVNVNDQTILSVTTKPTDCNAPEAIERIFRLVKNVAHRLCVLSLPGQGLTPGYATIHIGEGQVPVPPLTDRASYNLSRKSVEINAIVTKIITQYKAAYETKTFWLQKQWDTLIDWYGGSTPISRISRMEGLQRLISSDIVWAGDQADLYAALITNAGVEFRSLLNENLCFLAKIPILQVVSV